MENFNILTRESNIKEELDKREAICILAEITYTYLKEMLDNG